VTFALLIFIYYEHWKEVQIVTSYLRLALGETLPYLVLLILVNVSIQFALSKRSLWRGLLAVLTPNGYDDKPQTAPQYIVANMLANFALYSVLYLVLTFYCWECTETLSLNKLLTSYPVVAVMWLLNFGLTIAVWLAVIGRNRGPISARKNNTGSAAQNGGNTNYATSETSVGQSEFHSEMQAVVKSDAPTEQNAAVNGGFNSWSSRGSLNTHM